MTAAGFLFRCLNVPLLYIRRHITVNKKIVYIILQTGLLFSFEDPHPQPHTHTPPPPPQKQNKNKHKTKQNKTKTHTHKTTTNKQINKNKKQTNKQKQETKTIPLNLIKQTSSIRNRYCKWKCINAALVSSVCLREVFNAFQRKQTPNYTPPW